LSDLFVTLASGCLFGRFAFIDTAGRQFPEERIHRVTVLPDQDDVPRFRDRDEHHRFRVAHDIDHYRPAVRHPDFVAIDIKDLSVVDAFVLETFGIRHVEGSFGDSFPVSSLQFPER